jgi:hypothetical protein
MINGQKNRAERTGVEQISHNFLLKYDNTGLRAQGRKNNYVNTLKKMSF